MADNLHSCLDWGESSARVVQGDGAPSLVKPLASADKRRVPCRAWSSPQGCLSGTWSRYAAAVSSIVLRGEPFVTMTRRAGQMNRRERLHANRARLGARHDDLDASSPHQRVQLGVDPLPILAVL